MSRQPSDSKPSDVVLERDLQSNSQAASRRRLRWAAGQPDCPQCHGEGRVRGRGVNKDGTPRKLGRWELCACVPGRPKGMYNKRARPVVLYGVELEARVEYPEGFVRPKQRAECQGGCRPCPLVGCRQHTYLEVIQRGTAIQVNYGGREPADVPAAESCTLDLVDAHEGGMTLDEVAQVLGITRERVRQIEKKALEKLFKRLRVLDPELGEQLKNALEARIAQRGRLSPFAELIEVEG